MRQPSALAPGIPTLSTSGLPGYEADSSHGFFATRGTPKAVINLLHQQTVRILKQSDVSERFIRAGLEPVGSTPEHFAAMIKADIVKWGKVIKKAGIRAQ